MLEKCLQGRCTCGVHATPLVNLGRTPCGIPSCYKPCPNSRVPQYMGVCSPLRPMQQGGGQYSLALQGLLACARWPAIMCTHPQEAHVREDNTGSGASRAVAPSCTWCEVGTNSGWTPVFHCKAPFCASLPLALYTYTPHMAWAACFTHIRVHGMPCG